MPHVTLIAKLKQALFSIEMSDKIEALNNRTSQLTALLDAKDSRINALEEKVLNQEISADSVEQYSRRANIHVCGIQEADGGGEDMDEKVLAVLNGKMGKSRKVTVWAVRGTATAHIALEPSRAFRERAAVAPTFVTSTTFVTAHQFCQFISTAFVNLTTFVNFCQLRAHQFCQQYQPLMSLQTRSLLLSTRPDHFCQP